MNMATIYKIRAELEEQLDKEYKKLPVKKKN
jgi:hypothetical protein